MDSSRRDFFRLSSHKILKQLADLTGPNLDQLLNTLTGQKTPGDSAPRPAASAEEAGLALRNMRRKRGPSFPHDRKEGTE